jgi:hypothetical protein
LFDPHSAPVGISKLFYPHSAPVDIDFSHWTSAHPRDQWVCLAERFGTRCGVWSNQPLRPFPMLGFLKIICTKIINLLVVVTAYLIHLRWHIKD